MALQYDVKGSGGGSVASREGAPLIEVASGSGDRPMHIVQLAEAGLTRTAVQGDVDPFVTGPGEERPGGGVQHAKLDPKSQADLDARLHPWRDDPQSHVRKYVQVVSGRFLELFQGRARVGPRTSEGHLVGHEGFDCEGRQGYATLEFLANVFGGGRVVHVQQEAHGFV